MNSVKPDFKAIKYIYFEDVVLHNTVSTTMSSTASFTFIFQEIRDKGHSYQVKLGIQLKDLIPIYKFLQPSYNRLKG
jgi:hypothetical protein